MRDVGEPLGIDVVEAAWGIERIVNANMAERHPPGAGRVTAPTPASSRSDRLRRQRPGARLGHRRRARHATGSLVPKAAPAFCALGLLVADYVVDLCAAYVSPAVPGRPRPPGRADGRARRRGDARSWSPTGLADADVTAATASCRWPTPGQNFDMSVPVPGGLGGASARLTGLLDLAERFHDLHEADRGFSFRKQQPTVRGVRITARGRTPKPDHLAELGTGDADGPPERPAGPCTSAPSSWTRPSTTAPRWARAPVAGPALIEEPFTVVVVPPGTTAGSTTSATTS